MASIILDDAQRAQAQGMCVQPTVFRASGTGDGYSIWHNHAATLGRSAELRVKDTAMSRSVNFYAM